MVNLSAYPEDLRRQARELEKLRQQHLDVMKRLRILVMSLGDSWKGESQAAFEKSFLSQSRTMNDLDAVLSQYAELMNEAADETQALDNALLASVRRRLG